MREPSQIGQRMKRNYEDITRLYLPRRTYTIIRVDGRAFHTWTRGLNEPFDRDFMIAMDEVAIQMCEDIQGCRYAYLQSDEISFLLTDFDKLTTDAWFGGEINKLCSISAGMASAFLSRSGSMSWKPPAVFDGRAFTIPTRTEVLNYFIWRQQDCSRNSVQMVAQTHYSQKQLTGKKSDELQEMIHQKDDNWNSYPVATRRGRIVRPSTQPDTIVYKRKDTGETKTAEIEKTVWISEAPPVFTQDHLYLQALTPHSPDTKEKEST